jgi:hypothetical protein
VDDFIPEDKADTQSLVASMAHYIASLEKEITLLLSKNSTTTQAELSEAGTSGIRASPAADDADVEESDQEDDEQLAAQLRYLALDTNETSFYGNTSHLGMLQTALEVRRDSQIDSYAPDPSGTRRRRGFLDNQHVSTYLSAIFSFLIHRP